MRFVSIITLLCFIMFGTPEINFPFTVFLIKVEAEISQILKPEARLKRTVLIGWFKIPGISRTFPLLWAHMALSLLHTFNTPSDNRLTLRVQINRHSKKKNQQLLSVFKVFVSVQVSLFTLSSINPRLPLMTHTAKDKLQTLTSALTVRSITHQNCDNP